MNTAVAFLIYRRPDLTARVFDRIREARPPKLFIVADGPRPGEEALCRDSRAVVARVDWPCEVVRNYADTNMGCRQRVSSGIDWVFTQVEEAVIVEDDCLPDAAFFTFCEDLLAYYRNDERIGHIGGTDPCGAAREIGSSYYFSRYTSIWGWATWRRAWQDYDVQMEAWPAMKAAGKHLRMFGTRGEVRHFEGVWDDIHSGELDTWDGQWFFANLRKGRLSVAPNGNLVTNLGFRDDARHTTDTEHVFAALAVQPMHFPLTHPAEIASDDQADRRRAEAEFLRQHEWLRRLQGRLRNPHFYGALLRKIPIIAPLWAKWREKTVRII